MNHNPINPFPSKVAISVLNPCLSCLSRGYCTIVLVIHTRRNYTLWWRYMEIEMALFPCHFSAKIDQRHSLQICCTWGLLNLRFSLTVDCTVKANLKHQETSDIMYVHVLVPSRLPEIHYILTSISDTKLVIFFMKKKKKISQWRSCSTGMIYMITLNYPENYSRSCISLDLIRTKYPKQIPSR